MITASADFWSIDSPKLATWRSFYGFDATRARTLMSVASLSQQQLDFVPPAGGWSVGEILDHLIRAERLYRDDIGRLVGLKRAGKRPYIRRSLAELNLGPTYVPRSLLPALDFSLALLAAVVPAPVRDAMTQFPILPIRHPDSMAPVPRRPGAELRRELARSIDETRQVLASNDDLEFHEMVSHHPLTGSSTVPTLLRLASMHERRHQRQMAAVMAAPEFPAS